MYNIYKISANIANQYIAYYANEHRLIVGGFNFLLEYWISINIHVYNTHIIDCDTSIKQIFALQPNFILPELARTNRISLNLKSWRFPKHVLFVLCSAGDEPKTTKKMCLKCECKLLLRTILMKVN